MPLISLDTLMLFSLASVLLSLSPGPDNIFVLTQSALYGRRAGVIITIGLCTGLVVHTLVVALGLAVVFQTSAVAFNVLKYAGAAYLVYLAWQAFTAGAASMDGESERLSTRALYARGVIMNISNPKVAIFFLALLPQFVDIGAGSVTLQVMLLGLVFLLCAFAVFCVVALCAGYLGNWLRSSPGASVIMHRLAGLVFVGLAVRLALSER